MNEINVLLIDNFDSFTFNLVDEFDRLGCKSIVFRNNAGIKEIKEVILSRNIGLIVISPGGFVPSEVPLCNEIIREFHASIPIFGVCLGHECIIDYFGGNIMHAPAPVHGKSSAIVHDGKSLFRGIDNPMFGGRYHSQAGTSIPDSLEVTARTKDNVVMGVRHKKYFIEGVQFHPESVLTPQGSLVIRNLIEKIRGEGE